MSREPVEVSVRILAETEFAMLITNDDGPDAAGVWVPKSLCKIVSVVETGDDVYEVELPQWLARREGFI